MQGNMFEQQKRMAYLNAELRGYMTPGAGYAGNAASPYANQSSSFTQTNTGLTRGRTDAGRAGLGYGEPRAQMKFSTSKGTSIDPYQLPNDPKGQAIDEGNMKQPPFSRTDTTRQAFRSKKGGLASLASAGGSLGSSDSSPTNAGAGVASGLKKNQQIAEAGATGGPVGMALEMGKQEAEGQKRMGVGLGSAIGSSFA